MINIISEKLMKQIDKIDNENDLITALQGAIKKDKHGVPACGGT